MTHSDQNGDALTPEEHAPDRGKHYWLDQPRNIALIYWMLCAICALLAISDFFYDKHPYFTVEEFPAFYGIYGFFAALFIVFIGVFLRKLVMRDEDYYDR